MKNKTYSKVTRKGTIRGQGWEKRRERRRNLKSLGEVTGHCFY